MIEVGDEIIITLPYIKNDYITNKVYRVVDIDKYMRCFDNSDNAPSIINEHGKKALLNCTHFKLYKKAKHIQFDKEMNDIING